MQIKKQGGAWYSNNPELKGSVGLSAIMALTIPKALAALMGQTLGTFRQGVLRSEDRPVSPSQKAQRGHGHCYGVWQRRCST